MALDELIARLEKATGWDRKLDAAIALEVAADFILPYAPPYTGSIDMAMTLLPPNYDFLVCGCDGDYSAEVGPSQSFKNESAQHLKSNPAIALCIAALRARTAHD